MPTELLFLIPLAFVSGAINASVGGGGLILVPGLFAALPQALPSQIMGTDKFASVMGHATSTQQYARHLDLPWRLVIPAALAAFIGAYLGARVLYLLPVHWVRPMVIVLLLVMLAYTWFKPQFGAEDRSRPVSRRELANGLLLGAAIGFYDGIFGPGTGSFLLFLFVRLFHFDFLRAAACAKVVNLATNFAALCFLVPAGMVFYAIAIPLGLANIAGAVVGTRLAMRGGNQWIRRLFLVLALGLLGKLVFDQLRVWL